MGLSKWLAEDKSNKPLRAPTRNWRFSAYMKLCDTHEWDSELTNGFVLKTIQ